MFRWVAQADRSAGAAHLVARNGCPDISHGAFLKPRGRAEFSGSPLRSKSRMAQPEPMMADNAKFVCCRGTSVNLIPQSEAASRNHSAPSASVLSGGDAGSCF